MINFIIVDIEFAIFKKEEIKGKNKRIDLGEGTRLNMLEN